MPEVTSRLVVLAVLLLAVGAASVPASVGAEQPDATIERDTGSLVVTFEPGTFGENASTVRITVEGDPVRTTKMNASTRRPITVSLTADAFDQFADLRQASVVATVDGKQVANRTLSLAYVEFKPAKAVYLEDRRVNLPTKDLVGLPPETTVPVTVSGPTGTATLQATVHAKGLSLSLDAVRSKVGVLGQVSFDPGSDAVTLGPAGPTVDLRSAAPTSATLIGTELVLDTPLFQQGQSYTVEVVGPDGETRYARTEQSPVPGELRLSAPGLVGTDTVRVTVWRDETTVVPERRVGLTGAQQQTVATVQNGRYINFETLPASVQTLYIWNGSDLATVQPERNGSTLRLTGDVTLATGKWYAFVVQSPDGSVYATTGTDPSKPGSFSAALEPDQSGQTDQSDGGPATNGTAGNETGMVGSAIDWIGNNEVVAALLAVIIVLLGLTMYVALGGRSRRGDPRAGSGTEFPNATQGAVGGSKSLHVSVVSETTREPVAEPVTVELRDQRTHNRIDQAQPTDGTVEFTGLRSGKYVVSIPDRGVRQAVDLTLSTRQAVSPTLELPARTASVQVENAHTGRAVPDAAVTVSTGELTAGTVGSDGRVTVKFPPGTDETTVTATRDGYEDGDVTVRPDESGTISLEPRTGTLVVEVDIDSRPRPDLPVQVTAVDPLPGHDTGPYRETTDTDGSVVLSDVPTGEYRTDVDFPGDPQYFEVDTGDATVQADGTATARTSIRFTYTLPERERTRIGSVKTTIDDFATVSNRDTAIPRFYGSVIETALETAQSVPSNGHLFATADVTPDDVVAATVDAAERAATLVRAAMTTKRNTDLFRACQDLPSDAGTWQGDIDVASLLEWASMDAIERRQRVGDRLEAVGDRIESERNAVATADPAVDLWEEVRDAVRENDADDPVRAGVFALLAVQLADAAEQLFDEPAMRDRLERTVF